MNTREPLRLSLAERRLADFVGKLRQAENEAAHIKNRRIGKLSDVEMHQNGMGGELIFCRLMNLYPDLSTKPRSGGIDCITHSGIKVDVKTRDRLDGMLVVPLYKKESKADIFALILGTRDNGYFYKGYALHRELINDSSIVDLGYGPCYGLEQKVLHKELPQ